MFNHDLWHVFTIILNPKSHLSILDGIQNNPEPTHTIRLHDDDYYRLILALGSLSGWDLVPATGCLGKYSPKNFSSDDTMQFFCNSLSIDAIQPFIINVLAWLFQLELLAK